MPDIATETAVEKFERIFPEGFYDPGYDHYERSYKQKSHEVWIELLNKREFDRLLGAKQYGEITKRAAQVNSKTKFLLAKTQTMAIHDAVKDPKGAKAFASGLYELIYGQDSYESRFTHFADVLSGLPQRQSPVFAWPVQTIFPFLALPDEHIFLKPDVTKKAATRWGVELNYDPKPNWLTYSCLLALAQTLSRELASLKPRDMIDIQSFIWVTEFQGYKEPPVPQLATELKQAASKADADGYFSPESVHDDRERRLREIVQRRGQPEFRKSLIQAYGGRCAVTGCDATDALEASHIAPYRGPESNHVSNGLLLRCDIHTLFDLDLIGIEPEGLKLTLAPVLHKTCYCEFAGRQISVPSNPRAAPNWEALMQRWRKFSTAK